MSVELDVDAPNTESDLRDGEYKIEKNGEKAILRLQIAGREIQMETGTIGKLAGGTILIRDGGTVLYTTACAERVSEEDLGKPTDFTPLRVDYFERSSAAGRTNQGFFKRDGRPSDREVLISRVIDRSIRPLLMGWARETQTLSWVLSYDKIHLPSTLAVLSASASMAISEIPMRQIVGCVRVAKVGDEIIINPTRDQVENGTMELVVSGTKEGIVMIEGEADFVENEILIEAIAKAQENIAVMCDAVEAFAAEIGKEKQPVYDLPSLAMDAVTEAGTELVDKALRISNKQERGKAFDQAKQAVMEQLFPSDEVPTDQEWDQADASIALKRLTIRRLRHMVENYGTRIDGREVTQVRDISIETPVLPCTHGSALFTRGTTQALATITLGDSSMQLIDPTLHGDISKSFYLQYNFPPCSIGDVGRVGSPGRREVGHGDLAQRALRPAIPPEGEFPYTIRAESLVTQSDGSSSMATVCACCLGMMDAGIPISSPVAGVAMGLLVDPTTVADEDSLILTDILGFEDALGMMDFKVAGNASGVTSLQLDIKNRGLSLGAVAKTLNMASTARTKILGEMQSVLAAPRQELAASAPKILPLKIPPAAIGKLIGPGGKTIRALIEEFGLESCDVDEDGSVKVMAIDVKQAEKARKKIEKMVSDDDKGPFVKEPYSGPMPEVGDVLEGVKILWVESYGVFVEAKPGLKALCHISELDVKRVEKISDHFKVGDTIDVKVIDINEKNQLKLSRRVLLKAANNPEKDGDPVSSPTAGTKPKPRPKRHRTKPKL
eukprot:CAMPEP_0167744856 /NCGR_PEP_ID=MMETSP0110_2-20121227/2824_1 /TAXON_ID=629695 /ORGANISM="Gymnochlora sp., Strain CCMP2014" /LENGTH=781 /DNA_ID=CAMNT_0007629425 /DNA_START=211 /DNA_END=2556 /DNA_ORIENTATION=-